MHRLGYLGRFGPFGRPAEHLVLSRRQRVLAALPGRHGELRVDDTAPRRDVADGHRELFRRGVLEHVAGHMSGERTSQRPGPAQVGQDENLAGRQHLMELRRGGKAVHAGEVDINNRYVGLVGERCRDDVIPALDSGDHLQVRLKLDKSYQRAAYHRDILGKQDIQCTQLLALSRPIQRDGSSA